MAEFVHLHLRSEYSLLDGACRIKETVRAAKNAGMKALALTDRGVMFGAVSFYSACIEAGVRPIIGCEITLGDPLNPAQGEMLVLLVKDEIGYRNLSELVTKSALACTTRRPMVDKEWLHAHHEGLIALSGGKRGGIARRLLSGDREGAAALAMQMKQLFGDDGFYLELNDFSMPEDARLNAVLLSMGEQLQIPCVASNDVCFLRPEDALTRQILVCIGSGTVLDAADMRDSERFLKSQDEMAAVFSSHPELLTNTLLIAEQCRFDFSFGKIKLPRFDPPDGKDPKKYLNELAMEGLARRVAAEEIVYGGTLDEETYLMRIRYEQVVIGSMGYAPYFLIVADFVGWAKSHGIPTGPGRGSGAGSLIAYLIGITEVDPVRYGLLFESFLNPERISMPDFDIDFCDRRRDEVIGYVTEKYGKDHVCQIVTFGTMAARAAVRDVGRALGMPLSDVDAVARLIPRELKITLDDALKVSALREMYESSASVKRLIDLSKSVEGMPRHASTHAAGVVITDRPLVEYLPLTRSSDVTLTQYDMDTVARLGLLKFDFLALRYLTVIDDTVQLVREQIPSFEIGKIPLDDAQTYDLICSGRTDGMFQLESPGMRQLLTAFKPRQITDIMTAIALFRPGPMDSIDRYLENRGKEGPLDYPIPALAEILDETCGCIVYQEQVMQIFRAVAGYSYGKADVVRRAISKKKGDVIERERDTFVSGAIKQGTTREAAEALFEDMTDFANYGFKKSHAAAYALLSYQTAYLKTHYPAYYYASLLTSVLGNLPKMSEYITESAKMGIQILPPDINRSRACFVPEAQGIRFGLLAIKNVGIHMIDTILRERQNGAYLSLYDLLRRNAGRDLHKRAVESLIRAGALDGLDANRAQMLRCFDELIDQFSSRGGVAGQMDLFGNEQVGFTYPDLKDISMRDKLRMEKEVCGMCASGHLLDDFSAHVNALSPSTVAQISIAVQDGSMKEGTAVVLCGIITSRLDKETKNGDAMAFCVLEDRVMAMELVLFPKTLASIDPLARVDQAVAVSGRLSVRDEEIKLLVDKMIPLIPDERFHPETYRSPFAQSAVQGRSTEGSYPSASAPVRNTPSVPRTAERPAASSPSGDRRGGTVYLKVEDMAGSAFDKAVTLCQIFEGSSAVVFYNGKEKKYVRAHHLSLDATDFVLRELRGVLGEDSVVWKEKEKES